MEREQFVAQLEQAMGVATFDTTYGQVNAAELQRMYSRPERFNKTSVLCGPTHINGPSFEGLMNTVRRVLQEYLDPESDKFGNGLYDVMGEDHILSVRKFTKKVLRLAAVSGPEKAADKIIGWSRGGSFQYEHEALLNLRGGDGRIGIKAGVEIEKLPRNSAEVAVSVPWAVCHQIRSFDLVGGMVLRIACEQSPVFMRLQEIEQLRSHPDIPARWHHGQFPVTRDTVEEICQAIAMITGEPVSWNYRWDNHQENEVFTGMHPLPDERSGHSERLYETITEENLQQALIFHMQREGVKKIVPEVERAIKRLYRSQQALTLEDQAIELRIALEALFLSGAKGSGELNFRLALHAARDIGIDAADREKWFKAAKEAYNIGSQAIHRGGFKSTDREWNRQIIAEGQELCSEGIKKRIKQRCNPDWDKVILA